MHYFFFLSAETHNTLLLALGHKLYAIQGRNPDLLRTKRLMEMERQEREKENGGNGAEGGRDKESSTSDLLSSASSSSYNSFSFSDTQHDVKQIERARGDGKSSEIPLSLYMICPSQVGADSDCDRDTVGGDDDHGEFIAKGNGSSGVGRNAGEEEQGRRGKEEDGNERGREGVGRRNRLEEDKEEGNTGESVGGEGRGGRQAETVNRKLSEVCKETKMKVSHDKTREAIDNAIEGMVLRLFSLSSPVANRVRLASVTRTSRLIAIGSGAIEHAFSEPSFDPHAFAKMAPWERVEKPVIAACGVVPKRQIQSGGDGKPSIGL